MTATRVLPQLPLPHKALIAGCVGLIAWALLQQPSPPIPVDDAHTSDLDSVLSHTSFLPLNQIFNAIISYQPFAQDDLVEWFNPADTGLSFNEQTEGYNQLYNFSDNLNDDADDALLINDPAFETNTDTSDTNQELQLKIRQGDTLISVLNRAGITDADQLLLQRLKIPAQLPAIKTGESIQLIVQNQRLQELHYNVSPTQTLHIIRMGDNFNSDIESHPIEKKVHRIEGSIHNSLYADGVKAGLSHNMIHQLTKIFGWDIDFSQDIQPGDRFSIIAEENWAQGKRLKGGDILAAEFSTGGQQFRAFRYTNANGNAEYYNEKGETMRKAFLQAPVDVERITSGFNLSRMHPVLHRIMAHRGIDYAGRVGTPIKAAGDARVESLGFQSTFGNLVVLRHGPRYQTKYAHMSRFAAGLKVGQKVRQGQVIGYIGATGRVTGAHLHYEFLVNGTHQNPKSLKLNLAQPLTGKERNQYFAQIKALLAQLNQTTGLAINAD